MAAPIEVPNLDVMDAGELRAFAETLSGHTDEDDVNLWRYAMLKADAIEQRQAGRIAQAKRIEDQCDSLYLRLPAEYHW